MKKKLFNLFMVLFLLLFIGIVGCGGTIENMDWQATDEAISWGSIGEHCYTREIAKIAEWFESVTGKRGVRNSKETADIISKQTGIQLEVKEESKSTELLCRGAKLEDGSNEAFVNYGSSRIFDRHAFEIARGCVAFNCSLPAFEPEVMASFKEHELPLTAKYVLTVYTLEPQQASSPYAKLYIDDLGGKNVCLSRYYGREAGRLQKPNEIIGNTRVYRGDDLEIVYAHQYECYSIPNKYVVTYCKAGVFLVGIASIETASAILGSLISPQTVTHVEKNEFDF